jgi:uncharacterized Zn-finger protein
MYLSAHMKTHEKTIPTEADKTCSKCDKTFAAVWLKNQHDEIKHKGNEIFKCVYQDCAKVFSTSSKLQRHTRIHTKERWFKCSYEGCEAVFGRRDHLNSHLQTHSNVESSQYFYCDFPSKCMAWFFIYFQL